MVVVVHWGGMHTLPTHAFTSSYLWSASSEMYLASFSCVSKMSSFSSLISEVLSSAFRFLEETRANILPMQEASVQNNPPARGFSSVAKLNYALLAAHSQQVFQGRLLGFCVLCRSQVHKARTGPHREPPSCVAHREDMLQGLLCGDWPVYIHKLNSVYEHLHVSGVFCTQGEVIDCVMSGSLPTSFNQGGAWNGEKRQV